MIEGCKAFGLSYADWRKRRRFIASEIHRDGSFLDIGCGSGFLIASLAVWSGHRLIPFGIDVDVEALRLARKYFASRPRNFVRADLNLFSFQIDCWPDNFDYILWNIPNNKAAEECAAVVRKLTLGLAPNGKVILTQYATGPEPRGAGDVMRHVNEMTSRWEMIMAASTPKLDLNQISWSFAQNVQSLATIKNE